MTTMAKTRDEFVAALFETIAEAPRKRQIALLKAFKAFEKPRVRYLKTQPIANSIMIVIEEALMDVAVEESCARDDEAAIEEAGSMKGGNVVIAWPIRN